MKDIYHIPVLLQASVEGLNIKPDGIYADLTFGGGGHAQEILKKLSTGKLFAFDQDPDVLPGVEKLSRKYPENFVFFQSNFEYFSNFLNYAKIKKIDGIIADLGVSSHQFNDETRGFSFRFEGEPDMRMNKKALRSSMDILNNYEEEELSLVFKNFGELRSARALAATIVKERESSKIKTIGQLNELIEQTIKTEKKNKIFAKIYQALRIETNREIEVLKKMLMQTPHVLNKGGRLVVLSYHSIEDRLVKNFIKTNNFEGNVEQNIYGESKLFFKAINKKTIVPDEQEIAVNNRSRSAKLRIAQRI